MQKLCIGHTVILLSVYAVGIFVGVHRVRAKFLEYFSPPVLPGSDPAPLRGNHQASAQTPGLSREGGVPSQQSNNSTTNPLLPTLKNISWPEFRTLQDEFSTLVRKLLEALDALEPTQFENLLVYLRKPLRPGFDGCFPTEGPPNLPDGPITPSELVQHLQKCQYCDYLNTELLEDIIEHVTQVGSPLQSLMAKYKQNVCSKVKHTLKECKEIYVKPKPPPGYTTMAVVINTGGSRLSFHLYQILQLKRLLFGVNDALFAGFTEGSIVLYFYIPEEAVYSLCSKLKNNCTALKEQHVTTLFVFDHFLVDFAHHRMTLLNKVSLLTFRQHYCLFHSN